MENIERVIFNYLSNERVKSALLINGNWGSGKTHYVKESVIPRIKTDLTETKPLVIYQSLYGIKSIEELKLNLYIEAIPDYKSIKKFKKPGLKFLAASILHFWNINFTSLLGSFSASSILKKDKNYIFIFDDLERVHFNLGIYSVMGWINNFVEHLGFKTILVGDETKVQDKEKYFEIKEKLIGTTVKFETPSNVIDEINKNLLGNFKADKLIISHDELINRLYKVGANQNLRSYEFAIRILKDVLKYLNSIGDDLSEEILRKLIIYTVAVCFEYKKGIIKEENIEQLKQQDFSQIIGINEMLRTQSPGDAEGQVPIYEVVNDYFSKFGYSITIFDEVNSLIVKGQFDADKFLSQVRRHLGEGLDESKNIYNKLYNFRRIENEDELNRITTRAVKLCENGDYSLSETLFIADVLFYLTHNGVLDEEMEDLYNRFEAILNTNRNDFSPIRELGHNVGSLKRDYGDQFERLFTLGQEINTTNIQQTENEQNQQLFNLFIDDIETFLDRVWSTENRYRHEPIFSDWDPTNACNAIFNFSSNQIQTLITYLSSRYKDRPDLLTQEQDFLAQLCVELNESKDRQENDNDKLKLFSITELVNTIEDKLK